MGPVATRVKLRATRPNHSLERTPREKHFPSKARGLSNEIFHCKMIAWPLSSRLLGRIETTSMINTLFAKVDP